MRVSTFVFLLSCLLIPILSFPTKEPSVKDEEDEGKKVDPGVEPFWKTNPSHVDEVELYQSDMFLTEEQRVAMKNRKGKADVTYRWSEGSDGYPLVPYVFQDSVNQTDVKAGLDHWMEHTCIKFEETTINTTENHLQFHIGSGCWSYVGMYRWGGQQVSIGSNCEQLSIVVHEVGHAIGFHHEQSRADRDTYLTIMWDNIESDNQHNFDKAVDNNYSVTYDYSSNMHYGTYFFDSNDKPTLITTDPMAQELIGKYNPLTHRDKLLANRMYNCTGKWLSGCSLLSDPCLNEGYIGKHCTCICPPGTSGSNCENVDVDDYYANLRSPLSEKITTEKKIEIKAALKSGGSNFIKWIVPPIGKRAKLTFTYDNLYGACDYMHLRIRTNDSDLIGQFFCKDDLYDGLTLTSDTEIIIFFWINVNYDWVKHFWDADVTFENIPTTDSTTPQPSGPLTTMPEGLTTIPDQTTSSPVDPSTPSSDSSAWDKFKNICVYIKNSFDLKIDLKNA